MCRRVGWDMANRGAIGTGKVATMDYGGKLERSKRKTSDGPGLESKEGAVERCDRRQV